MRKPPPDWMTTDWLASWPPDAPRNACHPLPHAVYAMAQEILRLRSVITDLANQANDAKDNLFQGPVGPSPR